MPLQPIRFFRFGLYLGIISLIITSLLGIPTTPTAAQDNCPNGLTPTDCDLLQQSDVAMQGVTSFNTNFLIDFTFVTEGEPLDFNAVGSGPMVLTPEGGFSTDWSISDARVTFLPRIEDQGSGIIRIIDGMVFTTEDQVNWYGGELEDADRGLDLLANDDLLGLVFSQFISGSDYLIWQRQADTEINGQPAAVFVTDFDFEALIRSPEVYALLSDALASSGDLDNTTTNIAIDFVLEQLLQQASNSSIRGVRYISLTDARIVRLELDMFLDINLSIFGDAIAEVGLPSLFVFDLNFATNLSDFNTAYTITPPTPWTDLGLIELDDLLLNTLTMVIDASRPALIPSVREGEFDITPGVDVGGTLNLTDNPADTYRFSATAGQVVTITLRAANPGSDIDTLVNLFDINSTLLFSNDDTDNREGGLGVFDSRIANYTIPADGVYLIEATSVFVGNDGAYILRLDVR